MFASVNERVRVNTLRAFSLQARRDSVSQKRGSEKSPSSEVAKSLLPSALAASLLACSAASCKGRQSRDTTCDTSYNQTVVDATNDVRAERDQTRNFDGGVRQAYEGAARQR